MDGFAVAEHLRLRHPEAFNLLSTLVLPYECLDDGFHFRATGPILKLDPHGRVIQVCRLIIATSLSPALGPGVTVVQVLLYMVLVAKRSVRTAEANSLLDIG